MSATQVLGALRRSVVPRDKRRREQDPLAYSLVRQRDALTAALPEPGHQFVGFAEDEGVSGAVSPFRRPELGPWLTRLSDWDALAIARFDRVSRSVRDFSELCDWLTDHGKTLVCLNPPIDLSTPGGRAFAQMLAVFAEYERALIAERVRETWHALKDEGKWPGGIIPFGRISVPDKDGGWTLDLDPEYAPVVGAMVKHYVDGWSYAMIAQWLEQERVPPSRDVQRLRHAAQKALETGEPMPPREDIIKGKGWTPAVVGKILRSPSLGGFIPTGDEIRRDADNIAIRAVPMIPPDDYQRLQEALRKRSQRRVNASALIGITRCLLCLSPMHVMPGRPERNGQTPLYYVCMRARNGKCPTQRVPSGYLESLTQDLFLATVGGQPLLRPAPAATDHSADLANVNEAIENLEAVYATGAVYRGEDGAQRFAALMNRLEARRDKLMAQQKTGPPEYKSTGEKFTDVWNASDKAGRRMLMAEVGFHVYYARVATGQGEIDKEAKRLGITKTATELRRREGNLRSMAQRASKPERLAALTAELGQVVAQRRQLREIPRHREAATAPVGEELAKRAGLAASGQVVVVPDNNPEALEAVLAPLRAALTHPHLAT